MLPEDFRADSFLGSDLVLLYAEVLQSIPVLPTLVIRDKILIANVKTFWGVWEITHKLDILYKMLTILQCGILLKLIFKLILHF